MPVNIDILDFRCFNQLRNGLNFDINLAEFTPNLVGNIGEKVAVSFTAHVGQTAFADSTSEWDMQIGINEIVRSSGSFLNDSIQVGDGFTFYGDWLNRKTTAGEYTATVDFLSSDGLTLKYTVLVGAEVSTGLNSNVGLIFEQQIVEANRNTALFLKFGLIGNDETFNYLSKTTESLQVYYAGGLVFGGATKDARPLGSIRDWVSGEAEFTFEGGAPDVGLAEYTIYHEFILNPFYILAYREFIDSGTIPELLAGDSSMKYAAELDFRKTLTDTGSSKIQSFDGLDGFVGWYGENFNGLNNDYAVKSVTYEEFVGGAPLTGININVSTKVIITVENITGPITDYSCGAYLIKIPESEDDYIGTTTDLLENFLFKSSIVSSPATVGTGITTSLVSGDLVIEYEVEYFTAQKLQLTTNNEYLLLVQVEDPTISVGDSDRVMLIAALRNYIDIDFLADFINVPTYGFLQHGQVLGVDVGETSPITSNEDGLLLDAIFGANITRNVVINAITAKLIAHFPAQNKSFELDQYSLNIGDLIISGGVQQIEVNTTRGYPLPVGDDFNLVKVVTGDLVGDFRQYSLQLGQKIKWQDAAFNPAVDNVFFDSSQPNNNLNKKSSNYSGKQSYEIRLSLVINVTGIDDLGRTLTGDFINLGGIIDVNDYSESEDAVTGIIQTFDLETGSSLEGDILYNGKDTLFKAVFSNAASMQLAIHRIEPSQNQGDGITELSSLFLPAVNNLLKPLDGETQLKFDLAGSVLTTQCIIDGLLVQEGIAYKLSARAGVIPVIANPLVFVVDTTISGASASDQFELRMSGAVILYDVDWGDGNEDLDQTGNITHTYDVGGVYTISVDGASFSIRFANLGDKNKITNLQEWGGNVTVTGMFHGCGNMIVTATDVPTIGNEFNLGLASAFQSASSVTNIPNIGLWDVSIITKMGNIFRGLVLVTVFEDIGDWDTSNVDDMLFAFRGDALQNEPTLANLDVSSVTDMNSLFFNNALFNQDISGWDFGSVTVLTDFLDGTGMSTANYDLLLIAWDADKANLANGLTVGVQGLTYTLGGAAETARTNMISSNSWTFSGDSGV